MNITIWRGGGPMKGNFCGLFNNLNSTFNSIVKNLQHEGLKKETPTHAVNRCFLKENFGPRNI